MIRYLSYESVVEINRRHGGSGSGVREAGIVDAAVARPQQAFGGIDAHETLWQKAAALLHGLARTQGFHDGNKRTAWIACRVFLELNDHPLKDLPTAPAHAFMLTVAADLLSLDEIVEWLQVHQASVGVPEPHPQLHYAFLARSVSANDDDGSFDAQSGELGTLAFKELPSPCPVAVVCRIFWTQQDVGRAHRLTAALMPENGQEPVPGGWSEVPLAAPMPGGHPAHRNGLIPSLVGIPLPAVFETEGLHRVVLDLDGSHLASLPLVVVVSGLV